MVGVRAGKTVSFPIVWPCMAMFVFLLNMLLPPGSETWTEVERLC